MEKFALLEATALQAPQQCRHVLRDTITKLKVLSLRTTAQSASLDTTASARLPQVLLGSVSKDLSAKKAQSILKIQTLTPLPSQLAITPLWDLHKNLSAPEAPTKTRLNKQAASLVRLDTTAIPQA
jgi:hypothetical protein